MIHRQLYHDNTSESILLHLTSFGKWFLWVCLSLFPSVDPFRIDSRFISKIASKLHIRFHINNIYIKSQYQNE